MNGNHLFKLVWFLVSHPGEDKLSQSSSSDNKYKAQSFVNC